jgi:hypothetical protein
MKNAYKILVGTPEVKESLRRHKYTLEDNIKIDLKEIILEIYLAEERHHIFGFLKSRQYLDKPNNSSEEEPAQWSYCMVPLNTWKGRPHSRKVVYINN